MAIAAAATKVIEPSGEASRPTPTLSLVPAAGLPELAAGLEELAAAALEPNIFFDPRFLLAAMPRLSRPTPRLAVLRDRGVIRLAMPFTLTRAAPFCGVPMLRSWATSYAPLGTPLIAAADPAAALAAFLAEAKRPEPGLPEVVLFPDLRLEGPFAALIGQVCGSLGLPLARTAAAERACLASTLAPESYLKRSLRSHHLREFRRLRRRLAEQGALACRVAATPEEVADAMEGFLALEASGWKGRQRSALASEDGRAAFARAAVQWLAAAGMCRIHSLCLGGRPIASLIVFAAGGVAYTWKTAYDEALAAFSPGTLLLIEVTGHLLADPHIGVADSCAVPDHPVMNRVWMERQPIGGLLVGLSPAANRAVGKAARQLASAARARQALRPLAGRIKALMRCGG